MTPEPLRKLLPYTSVAIVIAALYVAYTFYSRKTESEKVDRQIAEKSAEQAREDVTRMGGSALKITGFYTTTPVISKGQPARLCYGVVNAKSLELEPPAEKVWPALSRCFDVSPKESVTYRLTARGKDGTAGAALSITVQ